MRYIWVDAGDLGKDFGPLGGEFGILGAEYMTNEDRFRGNDMSRLIRGANTEGSSNPVFNDDITWISCEGCNDLKYKC